MKYLLLLTMSLAAIGFTSCAHEHRAVSTTTTESERTVVPATSTATTVRTY